MDRETNRQRYEWTERQMDRNMKGQRQMDRKTNKQMYERTERQMDRKTNGQNDKWTGI
jgi:hypothetical protein